MTDQVRVVRTGEVLEVTEVASVTVKATDLETPLEGGLLFRREDGQAGCPQCGTTYATTNLERPTDCVVCDYDRVLEEAVAAANVVPIRRQKVGRNDPCPCGSGRKTKKCCEELSR